MKRSAHIRYYAKWVIWPTWVIVSMIIGGLLSGVIMLLLVRSGALTQLHITTATLVQGVFTYVLALLTMLGIPWLIDRYQTSTKEIGLQRTVAWMDIVMSVAGFIAYVLLAMVVVFLVSVVVPSFDAAQAQDLGFEKTIFGAERVLAFIVLVVIAPVVEEIIFRGYLYGKLRTSRVPVWLAMLSVSALFGVVHGQWNVGIDVFTLSMVACTLRETTGSIWAGMLVHMIKNSIAFYMLFVAMVPIG